MLTQKMAEDLTLGPFSHGRASGCKDKVRDAKLIAKKPVCWCNKRASSRVCPSIYVHSAGSVFCSLQPLGFSLDIVVMLTRQENVHGHLLENEALLGKDIMFFLHWPKTAMTPVVLEEKPRAMVVLWARNLPPHSLRNGDKSDSEVWGLNNWVDAVANQWNGENYRYGKN